MIAIMHPMLQVKSCQNIYTHTLISGLGPDVWYLLEGKKEPRWRGTMTIMIGGKCMLGCIIDRMARVLKG